MRYDNKERNIHVSIYIKLQVKYNAFNTNLVRYTIALQ